MGYFMRTFKIVNANGEMYDLTVKNRSFMHTVSGLGYGREAEFYRIGERFATLSNYLAQQEVRGNVYFGGANNMSDYFTFAKFCENTPLKLLYDPGTGKTYFIRHLITNFKKHHFLVLGESCLAYINDPSFIKMLMKFENSIVILEDCEKVLMERQRGGNELISTLLNITSGLLGDSLNVRVIATFNAKVESVDPAILRKGRMKVDYEFTKLSKEKTYALGQKLGKDVKEGESLTLADIYNYDDQNSFRAEKKKIGFGG